MTTHDPILVHLFDRIPPENQQFATGDRERWIAAMDAVLQFLYPPEWSPEARKQARAAAVAARANEGDVTLTAEPLRRLLSEDFMSRTLNTLTEQVQATTGNDDLVVVFEEAPSRRTVDITVDAVDDESGGEAADASGAGPAPVTSSPPSTPAPTQPSRASGATTAPSATAPTTPSTTTHARASTVASTAEVPPPQEGRKRHFTAEQKGAILRRVVREGMPAVQADTLIHESTLNRWMREMPKSVEAFTEEWEAEQRETALAEGTPPVEELEAEKAKPVPPRPEKPPVQWPSTPIERRPVDHERTRREQADWA